MLPSAVTASFTIIGRRPVTVEVRGALDASAAVGLLAVVDSIVRDGEVVFDLTGCGAIDAAGAEAVRAAVQRISHMGGRAVVLPRSSAVAESPLGMSA